MSPLTLALDVATVDGLRASLVVISAASGFARAVAVITLLVAIHNIPSGSGGRFWMTVNAKVVEIPLFAIATVMVYVHLHVRAFTGASFLAHCWNPAFSILGGCPSYKSKDDKVVEKVHCERYQT